MRTTGAVARRLIAGAFLGVVMTLSLAGIAAAQSNSSSNSNSNSNSNSSSSSGGVTTTRPTVPTVGGTRTTARTGIETWLPLMVGGMIITIAIATRVGLSRAAQRS